MVAAKFIYKLTRTRDYLPMRILACAILLGFGLCAICLNAHGASLASPDFPRPLTTYGSGPDQTLFDTLRHRAEVEPFNLLAAAIFLLAIIHTFLAPAFLRLSHHFERRHRRSQVTQGKTRLNGKEEVSFRAQLFHFLGEIEAVFGIWVIPLLAAIVLSRDWSSAVTYLERGVNFTEPMFVVVIMAISASRPILKLAERIMSFFAAFGKGSPVAWWFCILTFGPILGSLITEPAAMTICALLLARKFYERKPRPRLAYATLGLLFVNISVGGTLTHFAAPPVLMVASRWDWGISHMAAHFGWKAIAGIIVANLLYLAFFRRELLALRQPVPPLDLDLVHPTSHDDEPIPVWVTVVHLLFMTWTVLNSHYPAFFVGGFLFYLAFTQATQHHQFDLNLRSPLLVGFFLAGLVIHGGLQGWWIQPVLTRLAEVPLFIGVVVLTAFNDNAAITYLASLVPDFSPAMKYAVVAGAVTGGGLTVIANAPNPAGQSILAPYFPNGVSPVGLFLGAAIPTFVLAAFFLFFR